MKETKSILIIEDNRDIREGTAEILELAGYTVFTAENGKIGVDLAVKHLPDLILCDIMMPELDGYGVLYLLGKREETARIPFIFITAKAERGDMRKGMEMGADDYLTKPFDDMELMSAIESRLQKHEQVRKGVKEASFDAQLDDSQSEELLKQLLVNSRQRSYKKKQTVFQEGDQALNIYYIKSGKVRTYLLYQDGRELSTGLYKEGDYFGYESVLLNQAYSDTAETLEPSEIHLITKDSFFDLIYKKPSISKKFIRTLSGNIKEKEDRLLKLAYNSVRKRVADTLVMLAGKFGSGDSDTCTIRVSRDDLSSMVGTANETISRTLADFKDEKLIEKEGNALKILSVSKLRNLRH